MAQLSEEQMEFIEACELEFKDRYTNKDEEFLKIHLSKDEPPPIINDWPRRNRKFNDWNRQRQNGNRRGRYRNRQGGRFRNQDCYRRRDGFRERDNYRRINGPGELNSDRERYNGREPVYHGNKNHQYHRDC